MDVESLEIAVHGLEVSGSTALRRRLPFGRGSYSDLRCQGDAYVKIDINWPLHRYELFLLGDKEKKVTLEPETRKLHRLP